MAQTMVMERPAHPYPGRPRTTDELAQWHADESQVNAHEPSLPIVDAHHHLFGSASDAAYYRIDELGHDLGSGHRILGTVYVEAYESGWRKTGPVSMRPVGEVEMIADVGHKPVRTPSGPCHVGAGIVSHVDLMLGDSVADVLDAQLAASQGRLRGVRHCVASDDGVLGLFFKENPCPPHLLLNRTLRQAFKHLARRNLVFDAWLYHTQLDELIDLADAFPDTVIVLDHIGAPLGAGKWSSRRAEVLADWTGKVGVLASRPNIRVKIGGMGMPIFGFGFELGSRPATSEKLAEAWRPYIDTCIEKFGSSRCMFESNFPEDKQSCSYLELWNAFKLSTRTLSVAERHDLFFRTACRTYGLPELERLSTIS